MEKPELVVITGMSGAGKTVAMRAFEDLNYFTTDNLPPKMLPAFWATVQEHDQQQNAAVVIDLRAAPFFDDLAGVWQTMLDANDGSYNLSLVFLDATDGDLVARYKETRRHHPLSGGRGTLEDIHEERRLLQGVATLAKNVVDTSSFGPRELRQYLIAEYGNQSAKDSLFKLNVMSFGFKYGVPLDVDLVFDVRFLKNPYYDHSLRELTGMDQQVQDFVWQTEGAQTYYDMVEQMITWSAPRYQEEGKSSLTIAFGCTGGQHRSVAYAHRLAQVLVAQGWQVDEYHRDMNRRKDNGMSI
ncbi:MAG: RNase adapter RapZ [Lactobacillaceae bacterium]|jgi:UPF0042 nucleotide-binding protein|nr:RNase adapter RapZ [Lactobacillaceae bacterium]